MEVIVFFFLIVLPWFGHVFSNKGRFGHKRKLPWFFISSCPITTASMATSITVQSSNHTQKKWPGIFFTNMLLSCYASNPEKGPNVIDSILHSNLTTLFSQSVTLPNTLLPKARLANMTKPLLRMADTNITRVFSEPSVYSTFVCIASSMAAARDAKTRSPKL